MPQQKTVKKAAAKVTRPARTGAARQISTKQTKASTAQRQVLRVGGAKKPSGLIASLFTGTQKWVTVAAFALVFGGLGTYFMNRSSAAVTVNNYGCLSTSTLSYEKRYTQNKNCVRKVQAALKYRWGHSISIDGTYGSKTREEVKNFQRGMNRDYNPDITVDGKVGPKTWERLGWGVSWSGGSKGWMTAVSGAKYTFNRPAINGSSGLRATATYTTSMCKTVEDNGITRVNARIFVSNAQFTLSTPFSVYAHIYGQNNPSVNTSGIPSVRGTSAPLKTGGYYYVTSGPVKNTAKIYVNLVLANFGNSGINSSPAVLDASQITICP